jgi:plasmid maintenance system antidote protein VapI
VRADDALIDYILGIETIVSGPQDTTYKVALRLAAVIGTDGKDRKDVFAGMKTTYKVPRIDHFL